MSLSNDFLTFLIKIGVGVEVIAAIIGSIYFYKYKNVFLLKYFVLLLWYIVLNEFIGLYIRLYHDASNAIAINIYNVINFTYILLLYKNYLVSKKSKKLVLTMLITYLISFIVNGFFENYLYQFQSIPYIIASLFIIITILLYFREILNSEKVLYTNKNLLFWIGIGLLLYFVGNIPFRILRNYYEYLTDATILFLINFTLTIVMNTCFIIGFIWSDKKQLY